MSTLLQQFNGEMSAMVDVARRSLVQVNNDRNGTGRLTSNWL